MKTLAAFANSSIGRKWIVAITGLTLVGFVIVHMLGNLQIFWPGAGREHLNSYAEHLHDLAPLLWVARIILLVFTVAHIYFTYKLATENRAARPQRYAQPRRIVASVPVITMLLSGMLLFWLAVRLPIALRFAHNVNQISPRRVQNLHDVLFPYHWPQLFSAGGYLLFFVWMERRRLDGDERLLLGCCALCMPVVLFFGVWTETRLWLEWTLPRAVMGATAAMRWMRERRAEVASGLNL